MKTSGAIKRGVPTFAVFESDSSIFLERANELSFGNN